MLAGGIPQEAYPSSLENLKGYVKEKPQMRGFKIHGGRRGIRTLDTRIFSPLLYQLSYPTSMCRRMFTRRVVIVLQTFFRSSNLQDLYGERNEAQLFLRELFY